MRIFRGHATLPKDLGPTAVTIGNFDGVHLGHQALFAETRTLAAGVGGKGVVYTFEPHPVQLLAPSLAPPRLSPEPEKLRLIAAAGIDLCVIEPFNAEFAALPHEAFVTRALVGALSVRELIVGYDFTYGKGGAGNTRSLAEAGQRYGFSLTVMRPQSFSGLVASSTKIREFLHEGKVDGARLLLGRDYSISGKVVHGDERGRTIGFPTANLEVGDALLPAFGVYACWAEFGSERRPAVVNIGVRPTIVSGAAVATVEAFIIDWQGDLYDQQLRLSFVARLRDEQRFASLEGLKTQIASDVVAARRLLP